MSVLAQLLLAMAIGALVGTAAANGHDGLAGVLAGLAVLLVAQE